MPSFVFVDGDGRRHVVPAQIGQSAMRAATAAGVPGIIGECGGCMVCATCHVWVDGPQAEALNPPTPQEQALLDLLLWGKANSRLSCQLRAGDVPDEVVLTVPPEQG